MNYLFYIILFVITCGRAFSQVCHDATQTDLTLGSGSLAKLPALNQEHTGLCYAFTTAQLVDAYRYTHYPNAVGRISPLALGLMTSQSSNFLERSRLENGGSVMASIEAINRSIPLCEMSYFDHLYGSPDDQMVVFETLELMFKQLREAYYAPCSCTPQNQTDKAHTAINTMRLWMTTESLIVGEPIGGMQNLIDDLDQLVLGLNQFHRPDFANYNTSLNEKVLEPVLKRVCAGNLVKLPYLKITGLRDPHFDFLTTLTASSPAAFSDYAWSRLRQPGALPVGINFCSGALTGSSSYITPAAGKNICQNHAAVLAGTRCIDNKRQFLLRNSWGKNCGPTLAARLRRNCDGRGNLWVDGENLMKSSYGVFQVRP